MMTRALIAAAFLTTPAAAADDKLLHAIAGTAVYAATGSVWACAAAGVAKEALDATGRGTVEAADVVATVLPCVVLHALRGRPAQQDRGPEVSRAQRQELIEWARTR
jgi:hypothetical protein